MTDRCGFQASRRTQFNPLNVGQPPKISRHAFRAGEVFVQDGPVGPLMPNKRSVDKSIRRPAFNSSGVAPRREVDFNQISAQNVANFGQTIQLGDETLEKLLNVRVPDESDVTWLEEEKRLKSLGKSPDEIRLDPPFGRAQRTIGRNINFGETKLGLQGALSAIQNQLTENRVETIEEKRVFGIEIGKILKSSENIRNMSGRNMSDLKKAVDRLNIPTNYIQNGFKHRLFSNRQYLEQQGLINIFLLANPDMPNVNTPIRTERRTKNPRDPGKWIILPPDGDGWIGLNSMVTTIRKGGENRRFLDLAARRFISLTTALSMVRAGVDDGKLDGVSEIDEEKEEPELFSDDFGT
jgi:hypothetical protein